MDQKALIQAIEQGNTLSNEVKSILLELDTTASSSTQAYLNELLVSLRDRLKNGEELIDESTNSTLSLGEFETWIRNEFTSYSSNMYFNSQRKHD